MKKAIAILLALVLLTSNVGLAMVTHYCGGQAVKTQLVIGHGSLNCGMTDMAMATEQRSTGTNYEVPGCCEDQYQSFEIEDDFKLLQLSLNLDFVAAFVHSFLDVVLLSEEEHPQHAHYSPPLLFRDIPILNQTFII